MDPIQEFNAERRDNIKKLSRDKKIHEAAKEFMNASIRDRYSFNFDWLGMPIIQYPQDIVALQEIIWKVKPDFVIETGIARGGSIIFSASMIELLGGNGRVVGVDIDIRKHNRVLIERHPLAKRITMIEGSSVNPRIIKNIERLVRGRKRVMVFLDSNHSHAHVLHELELYSPFVTRGSYLIAFDTIAEYLPKKLIVDRPWGKGNSPKTAVDAFLKKHRNFVVDRDIDDKLVLSVAPGGYLKKIK